MYYKSYYKSPLGQISIICDDSSLCGLYFHDQKYYEKGFENSDLVEDETAIHKVVKLALDDYFLGDDRTLKNISIKPKGTPFQEKVWYALKDISFGHTTTYGELAKKNELSICSGSWRSNWKKSHCYCHSLS